MQPTINEELLVSIILPTYNRAGLITATIESIRHQRYTHWELLIIDDGSDDDTEKAVAIIADKRIFFYKAGRIGVNGVIKNTGLERSRGQLIAFIDSDDLWHPDKLAKQVAVLREYPEAGFSLTGGYNFRDPGKPIEYFYRQRDGLRYDQLFISLFRSEAAAFTQALLCRKECFVTIGPFKVKDSFSDIEFIVKLARHFKGVILYEPLLYRRIHPTNHSGSSWSRNYTENLALLQSYRRDPMLPTAVFRNTMFRFYISAGEKHLKYKQKGKALNRFLKAWKYRPLSIVPAKKIMKVFFIQTGSVSFLLYFLFQSP